jgi:putative ABC transport system permease protein
VDGPYWEILDFEFLEGGPFTRADEEAGRFVAVISAATRQRFFGGGTAVGRVVEADGQSFRVVGVVSNVAKSRVTASADLWVPLATAKSQEFRHEEVRGDFSAMLLARSRGDFDQIKAEFRARLAHARLEPPFETAVGEPMTRFEELAVHGAGMPEDGRPPVRRLLLMVLGMVAAFLVLPTTNLVSLNLSRIVERSSEIGVRKAFGASSAHLVVQFVFENVVLCVVGGAVALAGAAVVLEVVEATGLLPYADLRLNLRVFAWALGLACLFGLLSGAYPAWRTSRLHPVAALRGGLR